MKMKFKLIVLLIAVTYSFSAFAQSSGPGVTTFPNGFSFNCQKDTTIPCTQNCYTLITTIPNIKSSTGLYRVNKFNTAGGCLRLNDDTNSSGNVNVGPLDDIYTNPISLPFNFPFFGTVFNSLLASTNGLVSFDINNAGSFCHYGILNNGGSLSPTSGLGYPGENLPSTLYNRALIMGPYHDLDPAVSSAPAGMLINYYVTGVAPYRKWVLSYLQVPLFSLACNPLNQNTHQIVLYESTGIVEVLIKTNQICTGWNDGRSMVGMQDFSRTKGIMAPGRAASDPAWGTIDMNESWRFIPAQGAPLFKKTELFTINGQFISSGDTLNLGTGDYQVSFNNVCSDSNQVYIVKSTYQKIDDPATEIYSIDTIRALRNPSTNSITYPGSTYCNSDALTLVPTITGTTGGTFSATPAGLNINTTTGVITIPNSDMGLYTIKYHTGNVGGCAIPDATTELRIVDNNQFVWVGSVSSAWENPLNWSCNNLPNSLSDVIIYQGNVIVNSNVTVNSLSINPSVNITVNAPYNLTILH
jgi:hypothetical protein